MSSALVTTSQDGFICQESSPHQDIGLSNQSNINIHVYRVINCLKCIFCPNCIFCSQFSLVYAFLDCLQKDLDSKVENLHCAHDGEPSEESQCPADCWDHVHKLGCPVLGDDVKCASIKVDPHVSQLRLPLTKICDWRYNLYLYTASCVYM